MSSAAKGVEGKLVGGGLVQMLATDGAGHEMAPYEL